jgi:mannitol-specific phosphotransferase system IIBC component
MMAKNNQMGFGVVEALLGVIAVTLVAFVVFYVVNNRDDKTSNTSKSTTSDTTDLKSKNDHAVRNDATPAASDEEQIITAAKKYNKDGWDLTKATVAVKEIKGDNARGTITQAGTDSNDPGVGGSFIAHKSNGTWEVVFFGQQAAGKDIGTKYSLPADWYDASY